MKVKRVLKIIVIIIAILIILVVIHTIRNYIIITDLQNKISKYYNISNYFIKSVATQDNGVIITMEYYKKDNRQVVFMERDLNGEINKIIMYNNGERTNTFFETKDSKIAQLNSGTITDINIYNYLETDNKWQTFLSCINSKIKLIDYNGKECYVIKDFMSPNFLTNEDTEIYINKETGLFVRTIEPETVSEREYEFNNVDDSVFVEPNLSEYILKDNS